MKYNYCWSLWVTMAATLLLAPAASADIFKYVDGEGRTHYVDSRDKVPRPYRSGSEEKNYGAPSPTPKPVVNNKGTPSPTIPAPAPERPPKKDEPTLKRIVVPYKPFSKGGARRIIIPVTFNGTVTAPMIFDTGATGLHLSTKLAKKLGVFERRGNGVLKIRTGGIGGSVQGYRTILDSISVGSAEDHFVPTVISPRISKYFEGLVGMSFLANYTMTVDSQHHRLIFDEMPGSANRPGGHDKRWWILTYAEFGGQRKNWTKKFEKYDREIALADKEAKSYTALKKHWEKSREQKMNAEKLFRKLERYAAYNNVPMHWRLY